MNSLGNGRVIDFSGLKEYAVAVTRPESMNNTNTSNVINLSKKMDLNSIKIVKKDGTLEKYDIQKVVNAIKKSAERMLVELSESEIENICEHPFYIRVKILYGIDSKELPSEECFALNLNRNDWIEHDGWFYYKGIVNPGETTPLVFSEVEIVGDKIDNAYLGKTLTLSVRAHAVQSENNPVENPWEASGWPEE